MNTSHLTLHFLGVEELIKAGLAGVYVLEIYLLFYFGKKHGHKSIVKLLTLIYICISVNSHSVDYILQNVIKDHDNTMSLNGNDTTRTK